MRSSLAGFLLLAALALPAGAERYKDTAGTNLGAVLAAVHRAYPDAELIGISGRADATASALCDRERPADDGWRFYFVASGAPGRRLAMAECQGAVAGPVLEALDRPAVPIRGKVIDTDEALTSLAQAGVSLGFPAGGEAAQRPYGFALLRVDDPRFQEHPVFWQVKGATDVAMVNAATRRVETNVLIRWSSPRPTAPAGAPAARVEAPAPASAPGPAVVGSPPGRPARKKGYTALVDLERVRQAARQSFPGSVLMGIDGIVDAWGRCECSGPSDGWAYYFYWSKSRAVETIFACNGEARPGRSDYIPVDISIHRELPRSADWVDSDRAIDGLLLARASSMNEGEGQAYTRRVPLRLLRYRASPAGGPAGGAAKPALLWQAEIESSVYYLDAVTGRFVSESAK